MLKAPPALANLKIGRLFRDYVVLSGGQMFSKLLGFAAFAYLARVLTTSEYGAVETVVGMSVIGFKLVELGTGAIGVRRISQAMAPLREVLGAVISARMMLAIAIVPVLAITYSMSASEELPIALVWLFAISLLAAPFSHEWFFQANEKMGVAAFGPLLKMFVFLAALLALSPARNGVIMVGIAEILAAIAVAVYFSIATRVTMQTTNVRYALKPAVGLLKDSAPLGASAFVNAAGLYTPVLIVAALAGAEAAGLFGAAHRIVAALITFSYVYYFNIYPLFSRLLHQDDAALQRVLNASTKITAWVGVTAAIGLWTLGDLIMTIVFGNAFAPAGIVFKTLVWMGIFEVISGNVRWLLVAAHRQSSVLAAQIVGAAVAIGGCFALTPVYGDVGAAIAVVAAQAAIWLVALWRARDLPVRTTLLPALPAALAGIVALAVIVLWQPPALIAAIVAGAVMLAGAALDPKFFPALQSLSVAKAPIPLALNPMTD